MFKIGDKVKVKENYWEICDLVYSEPYRPIMLARKAMSESIGKVFIVRNKQKNNASIFQTQTTYLLENDLGKTDGFAWAEEFLELATIV